MKLDATKVILILVGILQSLIVYIGHDIQTRLNRLEFKTDISIRSGGFDNAADYLADMDTLTPSQRKLLEDILERSE